MKIEQKVYLFLTLLVAASLLGVLSASGQSTLGYGVDSSSFDCGGGASNSENYANSASIGQSSPISPIGETASEVYSTDGGFLAADTYTFTGFFPPVANPPELNTVKAGSSVPVKFRLDGGQGLSILAADSPASVPIDCKTLDSIGISEPTVGTLIYDAKENQYIYIWKTVKAWPAGSCFQLVVTFNDNSTYLANFQMR
jgi:hypothetical protein